MKDANDNIVDVTVDGSQNRHKTRLVGAIAEFTGLIRSPAKHATRGGREDACVVGDAWLEPPKIRAGGHLANPEPHCPSH